MRTSFMNSSLLLQLYTAYLFHLIWMVLLMRSRWPFSWSFEGYCFLELFNITRRFLLQFPSSLVRIYGFIHIVELTQPLLGKNCERFPWLSLKLYIYIYIYIYIYVCVCELFDSKAIFYLCKNFSTYIKPVCFGINLKWTLIKFHKIAFVLMLFKMAWNKHVCLWMNGVS